MENSWYLLQVSVCHIAFYALYFIFFQKSTFFRANRIYLLATLVFSFVIPLLDFSTVAADYHLPATPFQSADVLPALHIKTDYIMAASGPESFNFLALIYWIGFGFITARLLYSIVRLIRLKKASVVFRKGPLRIVQTALSQPFSFFNLIFLPKGEVEPLIVEHEKAHVSYCHWVDLLLMEIATAILWFNPVMIFYKKSIKIQHEYEADDYVIRKGASIRHYLNCILQHLHRENLGSPISQFYSQNIKKRIIMMTRKKTPLKLSVLYMLIIPVVCLLLFAFAQPSIDPVTFSKASDGVNDENVVVIVDAGHGGNDTGGTNKAGLYEKEFALTIAKNIQKLGESKGIKVILTRTGDNAMGLKERVGVAEQQGADAFISIHANNNQENAAASGIECVVSERSRRFQDSERLAEKVVQEFRTLNGISVNGIKKSNFYVLTENTVPAILLNLGYFSNKSDFEYMSDQKNQQQISERVIAAVLQYTK